MQIPENNRLAALANGDKDVIQDLYQKVFPKIMGFVLKNNGDQNDAEDVFQKALLQLIARYKVKSFVIESSFDGYVFTVCRNLWRRELNKSKRMVTNETVIELSSEEDDMTMATLEQEKWELFQEKLSALSDTCRQLLELFFKKIPYKDMVEKLGYSSDNVVRQRIFNCKKQLTKLIQKDTRYNQLKEL
ncbi:sigma-70 family RNA polymerase sigma factor [Aquimarina sp. 2201CG5-10]|uniref:RNA polymerase sigma factor n=1 Tax=Aquimarina callyspongiae TaxID=3098150 RepID=UPI002AB3881E|nr:sigma-70 family RNA polymerase sigma factor [Aquimarina sp. 2201CG5-10]MDY8137834.1 sigma-70 family RNA polymerase sigma factor [Aquimarina sp. 2201CG5-10]